MTSNFAYDREVRFWLDSTILDGVGRPACLPDGEAGIKTSYSPTGAFIGAKLGNFTHD